ncbi:MAG: Zn-dependent protease with chaperone function [Puniceicoccaceae bacterium 5H]|nr:MAG: Zn-dependent protease with chaperone function [Puniceicoccaceae bacterium 5H]
MAAAEQSGATLDFFGAQEQAHRKTRGLILYFALAVILIVVAVYGIVTGAIYLAVSQQGPQTGYGPASPTVPLWDLQRFALSGGLAILIIFGSAMLKLIEFSQGGGAVARSVGGRKIDETTRQPDERRLLNVVEEMAIASGVPVPEVYVLDQEQAINAFAAGHSVDDAAVAVTQGTLRMLNRDELQGVIAHEFSHILNGDMRLNLRLGGLLHGIMAMAIVGGMIMRMMFYAGAGRRPRRDKGDNNGSLMLILGAVGLAFYLTGLIGSFFGHLIQAAVSRQREFLADASAVQFTRNADGIGGALKKIGGWSERGRIQEPKATAMAHMFFASALKRNMDGAMATHPPLQERIKRIDPQWDGEFLQVSEDKVRPARESVTAHERQGREASRAWDPAQLVMAAGMLDQRSVDYARDLRAHLPEGLSGVGADPQDSTLALLALMMDRQPGEHREAQLQWLSVRRPEQLNRLQDLLETVDSLERRDHLPLLELAVTPLRNLSDAASSRLREELRRLAETDRRIDLREWCILTIAQRRLDRLARRPGRMVTEIQKVSAEMSRVLSRLALLEHGGEPIACFRHAVKGLYLEKYLEFVSGPAEVDAQQLSVDLERLRDCSPAMKRAFLIACGRAVSHDNQVEEAEAELFRALAIGLDVPMSPIVANA